MPLLEAVREAIRQGGMLSAGDRVVAAVSGGPDSVAMLHLLHRLSPEFGVELHVFHLDHGLRGEESAGDAAYVAAMAKELGLPATVVSLQPGQLKRQAGSLQANARRRRYQEITALAARIGANRVATGHNRDDQAETVLMRMLRGSGPKGLAGIHPVRHQDGLTLIRPLLAVSRREIERYCAEHDLFPRLDASNAQADYLRNRIRLELLPLLAREYNPAIGSNLAQLAAVMREEDDLLERLAREALKRCLVEPGDAGSVELDGARLLAEPLALGRRVVRLAARMVLGPEFDLGLPAVDLVLQAAGHNKGSREVDLPGGLRLTVAYGRCRFALPSDGGLLSAEACWPVAPRGETAIPELGLVLSAAEGEGWSKPDPDEIWLDAARLPGPLAVRLWRPGDRIWPRGMIGSKKLQDILVDAKVPRHRRGRIPLLVSGDEILWVVGYRIDRRFLADEGTERALRVRIRHTAG